MKSFINLTIILLLLTGPAISQRSLISRDSRGPYRELENAPIPTFPLSGEGHQQHKPGLRTIQPKHVKLNKQGLRMDSPPSGGVRGGRDFDSSTIANKDLRKAAILIELGILQATELKLQKERADLLQQRLEIMDSVMYEMTRKEMHYESLVKNHLADISWLEGSLRMSMEGMKGMQREVKREKRKTFLVGVVGVVGMIGVTRLFGR